MYIRAVKIDRDGEQYGTYYQAVRSYREQGKVKQEVVHLGEHATADEALTAWADEVRRLQATRPRKADKLRAKMDRLKELTCQQLRQFINPISDPNADPNRESLTPHNRWFHHVDDRRDLLTGFGLGMLDLLTIWFGVEVRAPTASRLERRCPGPLDDGGP